MFHLHTVFETALPIMISAAFIIFCFKDACNVLRLIGSQKRLSVQFRDNHPHIIAESIQFVENEQVYISSYLLLLVCVLMCV